MTPEEAFGIGARLLSEADPAAVSKVMAGMAWLMEHPRSIPAPELLADLLDGIEEIGGALMDAATVATMAKAEQLVAEYREAGWSDLAIGALLQRGWDPEMPGPFPGMSDFVASVGLARRLAGRVDLGGTS